MTLTMEQLDELPVGSTVTLRGTNGQGSQRWERVETGLQREGVTLGLNHFTAAVNDGLFEAHHQRPLRSGWWVNGEHVWYVVDRYENEWFGVLLHRLQYQDAQWLTEVPEGFEYPAIFTPSRTDAEAVEVIRGFAAALYFKYREQKQAGEPNQALSQALTALVPDLDTANDRTLLTRVMSQHGIEIPSRTVTVRIDIGGTTEWAPTPDRDDLDMPHDVEIIGHNGQISVDWEYTIETDVEYDGTEEDVCEDRDFINEDWVRDWLVDNMDFEWEHHSINITARGCDDC